MKLTMAIIALFIIAAFSAAPALAECAGNAAVHPAGTYNDNWLSVAPEGQRGVPEQESHARQSSEFDSLHREPATPDRAYIGRNAVPDGERGTPEQDSYGGPMGPDRSPSYDTAGTGQVRDWQGVAAEGQRGVPEQEPFAGSC